MRHSISLLSGLVLVGSVFPFTPTPAAARLAPRFFLPIASSRMRLTILGSSSSGTVFTCRTSIIRTVGSNVTILPTPMTSDVGEVRATSLVLHIGHLLLKGFNLTGHSSNPIINWFTQEERLVGTLITGIPPRYMAGFHSTAPTMGVVKTTGLGFVLERQL